jgi:HAD superfamily hydrolase (TIGR01509 family)
MVEAVIFDMDGLMVDSEPIQSESFETVLREHGVEPRQNDLGVIQTIGVTALDNWKILHSEYNLSPSLSLKELVARKREVYAELLRGHIPPMPGLLPLIAMLEQQRIKKAVASSSSLGHISIVTAKLGLTFDAIVSGEHVKRGKPHPDIFLKAAELLHVQPSRCVVLEDAESGVNGGKAAGMKVIAVPSRFTSDHDFDNANAVVPSLEAVTWPFLSEL